MKHIEIFNSNLNQDTSKRYERWIDYRTKIDDFLSPILADSTLTKDQALIIGCGNLDDLNLQTISKLFNQVTLTDVDLESVKEGIKRQGILKENLELIRVELSGFEDAHFFDTFVQVIMESQNQDQIQAYIDEKMKIIYTFQFLKDKSYDLILVSPIYTQLIYHQILNITQTLRELGHDSNTLEWIESYMLDLMPNIIEQINRNIMNILSPKGRLVAISDIFQSQNGTEFDQLIKKAIQSKKETDKVYQYYQEKYGYGLGDFGLYDLDDTMKVINYRWLIWPFDQDISMIVKIKAYKK